MLQVPLVYHTVYRGCLQLAQSTYQLPDGNSLVLLLDQDLFRKKI